MVNKNEKEVLNRYEAEGWKVLRGGAPDFLMLKVNDGEIEDALFVEVKSPSDKLSYEQAIYRKILERLGATYKIELINPVQARPLQPMPVHSRPPHTSPGHTGPAQPMPDHSSPNQSTPIHPSPFQARPYQSRPDRISLGHSNPCQTNPKGGENYGTES